MVQLTISHHWLSNGLLTKRQQTITWTNDDPVPNSYMYISRRSDALRKWPVFHVFLYVKKCFLSQLKNNRFMFAHHLLVHLFDWLSLQSAKRLLISWGDPINITVAYCLSFLKTQFNALHYNFSMSWHIGVPLWGESLGCLWSVDSPDKGPVMQNKNVFFVVRWTICWSNSQGALDLRCLNTHAISL